LSKPPARMILVGTQRSLFGAIIIPMANTQAVQIKVTLPAKLYAQAKANADKIGLTVASYIRHLAINDTWEKNLPTFKMTPQQEKVSEQAEKDYYAGKTIRINNIDDFVNKL